MRPPPALVLGRLADETDLRVFAAVALSASPVADAADRAELIEDEGPHERSRISSASVTSGRARAVSRRTCASSPMPPALPRPCGGGRRSKAPPRARGGRARSREADHALIAQPGVRAVALSCGINVDPKLETEEKPNLDFHSLRHTFASAMIKATKGDAEKVRRWTGHADIRVLLERYSHAFESTRGGRRIEEDIAEMDAAYGG